MWSRRYAIQALGRRNKPRQQPSGPSRGNRDQSRSASREENSMHWFAPLTFGLALVLLLGVPAAVAAQDATPVASPASATGDFAGLVDIGGRNLYLECHGEGSPTVVLVAGG